MPIVRFISGPTGGPTRKDRTMAEYMILIQDDETSWAKVDQAMYEQTMKEHRIFMENNAAVLRGGSRLHPTSTATSIRKDSSGNVTVTDGAFAETKEALGGYYLIDVADLDEAVAVATQVPAPFGGVEVRPVWPTD
jgi:hypothetical protein